MDEKNIKTLVTLPEELGFTEPEWYEYHYYLKRNLFLLEKLQNLPYKPQTIFIIEPYETYIPHILKFLGFQVDSENVFHSTNFPLDDLKEGMTLKKKNKEYEILLLLNMIEYQPENPETFIKKLLPLLKNDKMIFMITENLGQFKNRLKRLVGRNIFSPKVENDLQQFRQVSLSDIMAVFSHINLQVLETLFVNHYPPCKMEYLSVKQYILKYINYFGMKMLPSLRNEIFIKAQKYNAPL